MSSQTEMIKAIIDGVESTKHRPITSNEKFYISNRVKQVDMKLFKGKKITDIVNALITVISKEIEKIPKVLSDAPFDLREVFQQEIGKEPETSLLTKVVDEGATVDSLLQRPLLLQSIFNPAALHKKAYLILDRKYQSKDSNNINEFKWNVVNSSKSYDPETTAVTTGPFRDIIKVQMFPFRFPYSDNTITNRRCLAVEIKEFNTQCYFITQAKKRFHFSFDIESTGTGTPYLITDPGNSASIFEFHDPIISFDTITVVFSNPERIISLDPDSLYATIAAFGAQTLLTFAVPHWCAANDGIVISGFNTNQPVADAIEIELMNDIDGWPIITIPAPNQILINVDISGLAGAIVGGPFYVYLDGKRFSLRMELTYITQN